MAARFAGRNIAAPDDAVNAPLLSAKEAADYLSVSISWLYRSDVPYVRLHRGKKYRQVDLARYVEARVSHGAEVAR